MRRVSLWRLVDGGEWLVCDNCYDRESAGIRRDRAWHALTCPQLFAVVDRGDELMVMQADSDPRTAELHRVYLLPFGCDVARRAHCQPWHNYWERVVRG